MRKLKVLVFLGLVGLLLFAHPRAQKVEASPGWVSPTGYFDSANDWTNEPHAYDGNTDTSARSGNYTPGHWTSFLELTLTSPIYSNRIRWQAARGDIGVTKGDFDVYRDGQWVNVYEGSFADHTWVEKFFDPGQVTRARMRFYISGSVSYAWGRVYEFDFWELPADNQFPTCSLVANPSSGDMPLTVSLDGSGSSDPDGSIVKYEWDWTDDGTYDYSESPGDGVATHTYDIGDYTARLRVIDDDGAASTCTASISVSAPAGVGWVSPVAHSASPSEWKRPEDIYDDDLGTFGYGWSKHYNWGYFIEFLAGPFESDRLRYHAMYDSTYPVGAIDVDVYAETTPDHWEWVDVYEGPPEYDQWVVLTFSPYNVKKMRFRNRGSGILGRLRLREVDFYKMPPNQPPTCSLVADPSSGEAPLTVTLDGSGSSDPDGSIVKYEWDWTDDGNYDYAESPGDGRATHSYGVGDHTARLRITDDDGATSTCTASISVSPPPALPAKTMNDDSSTDGKPGGGSRGGLVSALTISQPSDTRSISERGFVVVGYSGLDLPSYQELENVAGFDGNITSLSDISSSGRYRWVGCAGNECVIDSSPCNLGVSAVVFVDGDLRISTNFATELSQPDMGELMNARQSCSSSLAFIVSGDINIEGDVNNIYGIFLAEGDISTGSSANPLYVFGSLLAHTIGFGRNLGADNENYPGERIVFMPRYFLTLGDYLGQASYSWKEVK